MLDMHMVIKSRTLDTCVLSNPRIPTIKIKVHHFQGMLASDEAYELKRVHGIEFDINELERVR